MRQRSIGLAHDEYLQVAKLLATHNLHAPAAQGSFAPNRQIPCIARTATMNHQTPPLITFPLVLSDDAAAKMLEFLSEIAHRLENHRSDALRALWPEAAGGLPKHAGAALSMPWHGLA